MPNEVIRTNLGVTSLLRDVERGRLRWCGHMKRMNEARIPWRCLQWKPGGRRPVERPRKRWIDGVDEAFRNRGTSVRQVEIEEIVANCSLTDR